MGLEIRAELEKSIVEQNYRQNIGYTVEKVKVCSRGQALYSSYATWRNRVKPAKTSMMEMLISIVEDMRTILRSTDLLRFLLAMTHTEIQYDKI